MILCYYRERKRKQSHKLDGSVAATATAIRPAGLPGSADWPSVSLSPSLSVAFFAFSLPPSHPFLGVVLILERKVPAFASPITKKRKIKNTIEKYPTVILEVRKEVKEAGFSVPLGGILPSEGAWVRNARILIKAKSGYFGTKQTLFVSHFIPHSVLPSLLPCFLATVWLLLFQFIFTCEESVNHILCQI